MKRNPSAWRVLIGMALIVPACGGAGAAPVSPSVAPATPAPAFSGIWRGTTTELYADMRTFQMTMTLSQDSGSTTVTGSVVKTFGTARFEETITKGTQSGSTIELETVLVGLVGSAGPITYRYQGTLQPNGIELVGSTAGGSNPLPCCSWSVRR